MVVSNTTSRIAPHTRTSAAETTSETARLGRRVDRRASGSMAPVHAARERLQAERGRRPLGLAEDENASRPQHETSAGR